MKWKVWVNEQAVQPIILITSYSYAATFGEHVIAIHNPLEETEEEEITIEITVTNNSQG